MTPKDKAKELVYKFLNEQNDTEEISQAKQCALICVDEILEIQYSWSGIDGELYLHWLQVKQEVNKL